MGPIYLGQFHLICHGICEDEAQLQDFRKPPLNTCGIPADINTNN